MTKDTLFCEQHGGVNFQCVSDGDQVSLVFNDPSYAKAEKILLDRESGALHAVLHENAHYLGRLDPDILAFFLNKQDVTLAGTNGQGKQIILRASLSVVDH